MEIKIKFPAIVFYTQKVEKGKGYVVRGKTAGPLVFIGMAYKQDIGLLQHELTHVRQFWRRGLLVHMLLYYFIRAYRLKAECAAYYVQWLAGERTETKKEDFTDRIWLFYNLNYPREYVKNIFSSYFSYSRF